MVLLISTYDLGRQPFGLASAAAALRAAGADVVCADLAKERLARRRCGARRRSRSSSRCTPPRAWRCRSSTTCARVNPGARLVAYGLYAPLNASLLREHGVSAIIGGEFEDALVASVKEDALVASVKQDALVASMPRRAAARRDRTRSPRAFPRAGSQRAAAAHELRDAAVGRRAPDGRLHRGQPRLQAPLPPLSDRAGLRRPLPRRPDRHRDGRRPRAGRRGRAAHHLRRSRLLQRHRTRDGSRRAVRRRVARRLVRRDDQGRAPARACRRAAAAARHRLRLRDDRRRSGRRPRAARGSRRATRAPTSNAWSRTRATIGLTLAPTFVAFTPWTTLEGYCELLQTIDRLELVEHVSPIQLAIRLLVTEGSRLLELPDVRAVIGAFNPRSLTYPVGPRGSRASTSCRQRIEALVGRQPVGAAARAVRRIWALAHEAAGLAAAHGATAGRPGTGDAFRISTSPGTVARSPRRSRLLSGFTDATVTRVLLLSTTTGYQLRSFNDAAEQLGIELVFATDRCQQLDDPWRDRAIAVRFHEEDAVDRGDRRRRPADAVSGRARGRGPSRDPGGAGGRAARASRPSPRRGRRQQQQARDPASPRRRRSWPSRPTSRCPRARDGARAAADARIEFPCVLKPLGLSGSRGVIRADSRQEFAAAFDRISRAARAGRRARGQDRPRERRARRALHPRPRVRRRRGADRRNRCRSLPSSTSPTRSTVPSSKRRFTSRPSSLGPASQRQLVTTIQQASDALGLRHGPVHAECRCGSRRHRRARSRRAADRRAVLRRCCGSRMARRSSTCCCGTRSARTCRRRRARRPRRRS